MWARRASLPTAPCVSTSLLHRHHKSATQLRNHVSSSRTRLRFPRLMPIRPPISEAVRCPTTLGPLHMSCFPRPLRLRRRPGVPLPSRLLPSLDVLVPLRRSMIADTSHLPHRHQAQVPLSIARPLRSSKHGEGQVMPPLRLSNLRQAASSGRVSSQSTRSCHGRGGKAWASILAVPVGAPARLRRPPHTRRACAAARRSQKVGTARAELCSTATARGDHVGARSRQRLEVGWMWRHMDPANLKGSSLLAARVVKRDITTTTSPTPRLPRRASGCIPKRLHSRPSSVLAVVQSSVVRTASETHRCA